MHRSHSVVPSVPDRYEVSENLQEWVLYSRRLKKRIRNAKMERKLSRTEGDQSKKDISVQEVEETIKRRQGWRYHAVKGIVGQEQVHCRRLGTDCPFGRAWVRTSMSNYTGYYRLCLDRSIVLCNECYTEQTRGLFARDYAKSIWEKLQQ